MQRKGSHLAIILIGLMVITMLLGRFYPKTSSINTTEDEAARLSTNDNISDDSLEPIEKLTRTDYQGEVSIDVLFTNPIQENNDYLVFEVSLNTHTIVLDKFDLAEMVSFTDSDSTKIDEVQWEVVEGQGHHIFGLIKIPSIVNGRSYNYLSKAFIELQLVGFDDSALSRFMWERDSY